MNAASRVNSPIVISRPPTSSITPAKTSIVGSGWTGNGTGKPKNFDSPCSRNSNPVTMRRIARICDWYLPRYRKSICDPPLAERGYSVLWELSAARQVSGVFLRLRRLRSVGRILRQKLARAVNHVDPVVEGMGESLDQFLERTLLQATAVVKAVVADVAEIGLGLLHDRHVEKHRCLTDLMVSSETADASRRCRDDRTRLLVEHALPVGPRADVDRVLQDSGDATIILGTAEQHAVRLADLLAETGPLLGRIGIEVLVVEREVADLDHRTIEIVIT